MDAARSDRVLSAAPGSPLKSNDYVMERCHAAIQACRLAGHLDRDAYRLAQWKGDAVLSLEMRKYVDKHYCNMCLGEKALLVQLSVGNRALAELHSRLQLSPSRLNQNECQNAGM